MFITLRELYNMVRGIADTSRILIRISVCFEMNDDRSDRETR